MLQIGRERPSRPGETIDHDENQMTWSSFAAATRKPSFNLTGKEPVPPLRATA
jgi:hypothetical protein